MDEEGRARFGDVVSRLMVAQMEAIRSIRGNQQRLPVTDRAITAHLKQHSPPPGPDGKRWAVRGIPLGGGKCWTAGVFRLKEDACEFLRFWGSFVYTEVKLAEVEKGTDAWTDEPLDDWERHWNMRQKLPAQPVRRQPSGRHSRREAELRV